MATVKTGLLAKLSFVERQGDFNVIGNLGELLTAIDEAGGSVISNSKGTGLVLRTTDGICNVIFSNGVQDELKAGTLKHEHLITCPIGQVTREDNGETMYILGRPQGSTEVKSIDVKAWVAKGISVPKKTMNLGLDKLVTAKEG